MTRTIYLKISVSSIWRRFRYQFDYMWIPNWLITSVWFQDVKEEIRFNTLPVEVLQLVETFRAVPILSATRSVDSTAVCVYFGSRDSSRLSFTALEVSVTWACFALFFFSPSPRRFQARSDSGSNTAFDLSDASIQLRGQHEMSAFSSCQRHSHGCHSDH